MYTYDGSKGLFTELSLLSHAVDLAEKWRTVVLALGLGVWIAWRCVPWEIVVGEP